MTQTPPVTMGVRLPDWISIGVLAASVGRDVVDEAVMVCGRQAQRCDGKLPPHVMVYFVMALALFADEDYEEVLTRLSETLSGWDCWDAEWEMPESSGITQARKRLGYEPVREVFEQVCQPVAEESTRGRDWPGGVWCRSTASSGTRRTLVSSVGGPADGARPAAPTRRASGP